MTDLRQRVIIGDQQLPRADWLIQFLNDYYNATSETAFTFDQVASIARKSKGSIIFLTDTLPYSYDFTDPTTNNNFIQLEAIDHTARLVCVVTGRYATPITGVRAPVCYVRLPSVAPNRDQRDQIIRALEPLADKLPLATTTVEEVARVTRWRPDDRRLHEQLLSLSHRRDLKDAERHLHRLLRDCLDYRSVTAVEIAPLVQGKSGALVFRVKVTSVIQNGAKKTPAERHYVLKISRTDDVWKLESEVNGYLKANKTKLYTTYKAHIPALRMPRMPRSSSALAPSGEEFKYIVSSLPWDAIHYDFLGGQLGECMSLDDALISHPGKIQKRTSTSLNPKLALRSVSANDLRNFRLNFLEIFLDALSDIWYANDACRIRKKKVLWKRENAHERKYLPLPPYQLTKRIKYRLEEFLDGAEAGIGRRLFPEFDDCKERVLKLIGKNKLALGKSLLGQSVAVTLSPVHGDLNGTNAFLWLNEKGFPFLIDFPFYQREGHIVQDFARLEVEVKFGLMDRQEETPPGSLAAFDQTPEQMALWREFEKHLLNHGAKKPREPRWRARGFAENVNLTYQLVRIIRNRAERAQQKPCGNSIHRPIPFMDEYLPALLYHTMKAISFQSLSIFKRLLAVYSAGSILQRLGVK